MRCAPRLQLTQELCNVRRRAIFENSEVNVAVSRGGQVAKQAPLHGSSPSQDHVDMLRVFIMSEIVRSRQVDTMTQSTAIRLTNRLPLCVIVRACLAWRQAKLHPRHGQTKLTSPPHAHAEVITDWFQMPDTRKTLASVILTRRCCQSNTQQNQTRTE